MYTERTQQFLRKKKSYLKKPKRLEGLRPRNMSAAPAIATSASTTTTARVWPSVVATIVVMADPIIFQWLFFLNLKIKLTKKENTKNKVLLLFPDQQQRSRESRTWRCLWRLLYRLPSVHNQHIGAAALSWSRLAIDTAAIGFLVSTKDSHHDIKIESSKFLLLITCKLFISSTRRSAFTAMKQRRHSISLLGTLKVDTDLPSTTSS